MILEEARNDVSEIFQNVLREVDPERLVREAIELDGGAVVVRGVRYELGLSGRVVLLGVGKSAIGMARGAESVLGDRLDHGLIVTKVGLAVENAGLRRTEVLEAGHPIPDQSSIDAGNRLLAEASKLEASDLAIVLVSGGGSALVEAPVDGITLDDFRRATSTLLKDGADIWTLNAVRRRLSRIKAGGLARVIRPARYVNLILSDVLGNPLGVIASGLSVEPDENDTWRIESVKSRPVWKDLPTPVRERIELSGETASEPRTVESQTVVVGDANLAARAAEFAAERLGYRPLLLGTQFAGDAQQFGRFWAQLAKSIVAGESSIESPVCVIGAGEMTVTVRGNGSGGRNTEMAATAALEIDGRQEIVIASLATDGDDGSSLAAGGVVDGNTIQRLRDKQLDPRDFLERSDTRAFLDADDGLIVTGQTGINVNDLYLALIGDSSAKTR